MMKQMIKGLKSLFKNKKQLNIDYYFDNNLSDKEKIEEDWRKVNEDFKRIM